MELKLYYIGEGLQKIKEEEIEKLYGGVREYFGFDLDEFSIYLHKTREEYDKQLKRKTKLWNVSNSNSEQSRIDIFHPEVFDKESDHPKSDFPFTLKHEVTHLFVNKLSRGRKIPLWLDEGVSYYVSGQYENKLKQNCHSYYIEENFCKKLGTSQGWNLFVNYGAYPISALFVYFLVKTFSFDKVKELITLLDKNYCYPFFKEKFEKVFGITIEDAEREFVKDINGDGE